MDRRDVLKRLLYPKCKTAIEFQFDTLIANPMLSYITVQDVVQLNKIATSIKYSSKPKEKYKMIDSILVPRGFVKMASGTNRVTYRYLNDYRVVLKVAIDKVGLSDNGNEYRNQHLLKPFVTKCFEVSPCGTVGLFERVVPITSREEFVNISEDVFDLINNLIGKYVLEDIGEKFYMNYGLREGFGPVLLDYPYVFELDGRKLICNVPEPMEPNGYCGGEIDYDIGYNNLICTKCGKRYLATELKSEEKSDKPKIIVKGEDMIMKCVLKRGDQVVSVLNSEEPVSTNTIKPKKEFSRLKGKLSVKEEESKETYKPTIKTHDDVTLQARLKGKPKSKTSIDEVAKKKEEKIERNTPKISVSFTEDDMIKPQEKEESTFKATFSKTSKEFSEENKESVETPTSDILVQDENEKDRDIKDVVNEYLDENGLEAVKKREVECFRAQIRGGHILNLDSDEIVGYTPENESSDGEPDCNCYDETTKEEDVEESPSIKSDGFSIGEIIGGKLDKLFEGNENNYTTNSISAPIEEHYSAAGIKDKEEDVEESEEETEVSESEEVEEETTEEVSEEVEEETTEEVSEEVEESDNEVAEEESTELEEKVEYDNGCPDEESTEEIQREIPELIIHPREEVESYASEAVVEENYPLTDDTYESEESVEEVSGDVEEVEESESDDVTSEEVNENIISEY